MFKKFAKKLHRPGPGSSPLNTGANNQRSDRWRELFTSTQTILEIAKESVKAVPVPGLEAAISGLSAILNVYGTMRANEDALELFGEAIERLDKHITRPLKDSLAKDQEFLDEDLTARLNELAEQVYFCLAQRAEALCSRKTEKKFFGYKEDSGTIQELNRELDRIILTFTAQGSIGGEVEARKARKAAQMLLINGLRRAQARHDSSSRAGTNGCFEGTRIGILQAISAWIEDPASSPIFWLSGMAGIGKSTIAQTVAELEDSKRRLGASFFFSRDDAERRDPGLFCPTIAYQLAIFDDALKFSVTRALEKDPDVAFVMMRTQFEQLIAKPLKSINTPGRTIVLVLDALDECDPSSGAVEILRRWAVELPRISQETKIILKVLVTSRPELHIQNQFQSPSFNLLSQQFILHNVEESVVQADIELFLRNRFAELADLHSMAKPWPSEAHLLELVERSGNLFIFAATAINFIAGAKRGRLLQTRLEMLLEPVDHGSASIYQKLDACYLHVLQNAERELEPTIRDAKRKFRLILETIVFLRNPLPIDALESLLSLAPGDVIAAIQDLGSVLVLPDVSDHSTPVRIFHPSFHDFITSPGRDSGDFSLSTAECHVRLAQQCFSVIRKSLKRNSRFLDNPWLRNSEVLGGVEHLETMIPAHMRYVCRFLASHISLASICNDALVESMKIFCENDLLTWLEAMSLLGDIDGAVSSIQAMRTWCSKTPSVTDHTNELLYDAYRVLLQYQLPLRQSAGHLYTSVLSFSPSCALTRQYASQLRVEYVRQGKPEIWDASRITLETRRALTGMTCFPDGVRIVTADDTASMTVWSSTTGAPITSVECELDQRRPIPLAVAHDGSRIASAPFGLNSIFVWDANTGANVAIIEGWVTEVDEPFVWDEPDERCSFVGFLPGSNDIVFVRDVCTFYWWDSQTKKVKYTCDLHDKLPTAVALAQDGSTLATVHGETLRIWDIEAEKITFKWKLRGPGSFQPVAGQGFNIIAFLPGATKIAWYVTRISRSDVVQEIEIWDYISRVRLQRVKIGLGPFAFSWDGTRLAFADGPEIRVVDADSFAPLGRLVGHGADIVHMEFLRNGLTLVSMGADSTVRTWDCAELFGLSPKLQYQGIRDSILASRNGEQIAVFYCLSDSFLLWDLSQQTSRKLNAKVTGEPVMSPDGRFVAFGQTSDGRTPQCTWFLYETKTLEWVCKYQLAQQLPGPSAFSVNGDLLAISATARYPIAILICNLVSKTVISTGKLHHPLMHMAFSPDAKLLLCVGIIDATFTMLNVSTGKAELSIKVNDLMWPIRSVRFSPEGLSIFVVMMHGEVATLEAKTLRVVDQVKASRIVQVAQTSSGTELTFLRCGNEGYLYQFIQGKEIPLIWLPPSWRGAFGPNGEERTAIWQGSRLMLLLETGELGILDLQVVGQVGGE
ncbi:hypothetical protein FRC01_000799 [Tulasnella sp. 417]|nr:hypothetical protein FRC01_000799 [Tulasnella sp. 417]